MGAMTLPPLQCVSGTLAGWVGGSATCGVLAGAEVPDGRESGHRKAQGVRHGAPAEAGGQPRHQAGQVAGRARARTLEPAQFEQEGALSQLNLRRGERSHLAAAGYPMRMPSPIMRSPHTRPGPSGSQLRFSWPCAGTSTAWHTPIPARQQHMPQAPLIRAQLGRARSSADMPLRLSVKRALPPTSWHSGPATT